MFKKTKKVSNVANTHPPTARTTTKEQRFKRR